MIVTESIQVNGRKLVKTYSDRNVMIERDGVRYDAAKWAEFKKRLEVDTVTQEQFNAMMDTWLAQNRNNPASEWAKETWEKLTEKGLFDGTAPQNPLTREQAALLIERLNLV